MRKLIIKTIREIIDNEPLRVNIYNEEIIFYIWEIEVPIVFDRNSFKVYFKTEYLLEDNLSCNLSCNINADMLNEMSAVIKAIESQVNEIKDW